MKSNVFFQFVSSSALLIVSEREVICDGFRRGGF